VGVLFSLETISFDEQKLFSFMKSHLSVLSLSYYAAGVPLRKFLPIPTSELYLIVIMISISSLTSGVQPLLPAGHLCVFFGEMAT
jgi:hypothetical protein